MYIEWFCSEYPSHTLFLGIWKQFSNPVYPIILCNLEVFSLLIIWTHINHYCPRRRTYFYWFIFCIFPFLSLSVATITASPVFLHKYFFIIFCVKIQTFFQIAKFFSEKIAYFSHSRLVFYAYAAYLMLLYCCLFISSKRWRGALLLVVIAIPHIFTRILAI